ncbi:unnamed protein product [Thelazia callipaeda]|uniref:Transcription initiation factor TFIID subunit 9 n=1 Tax=Thelazia callipaeda TaxID=103827 RepID=A0A0N5D1B6_THECL|nr:unnamed protein product [Thelazia callipaeda]
MSAIPHDAQVMQAILKDMGITEYEPRVISQLLEFAYKYTTEILDDARSVSEHAGKKQIDETDVQFAIDNAASTWKSERPNKQLLVEFAEQKNAVPLPSIRQNYGLRLPNDRFCLIQPNMSWKSNEQLREINEQMSRKEEPIVRSTEAARQTRPEAISSLLKRKANDDEDFDVP